MQNKRVFFSFFSKKIPSLLVVSLFLAIGGLVAFAAVSFPGLTNPGNWQVEGGKFKTIMNNISNTNGCWNGNYLQWFSSNGALICRSLTSLSSSPGSTVSNWAIIWSGLYTQYFKNILNDCWDGRYVRGFNGNKQMICSNAAGQDTIIGTSISTGGFPSISWPNTSMPPVNYTNYFNKVLTSSCWAMEAITGFNSDGSKRGCIGMVYTFNQTLASNTQNYDLRAAAIWNGWNGVIPLKATITVNPGVYVWGGNTSSFAFDTWAGFPAWSSLSLINYGTILWAGGGGWGGSPGKSYMAGGGWGGGPALIARVAINITNNGIIGWWGGWGGWGGSNKGSGGGWWGDNGGGWGWGQGYYGWARGGHGTTSPNDGGSWATAGTLTSMGYGGNGDQSAGRWGNGGGLWSSGNTGGGGWTAWTGGAGGIAVQGNGNITWTTPGARYWAIY